MPAFESPLFTGMSETLKARLISYFEGRRFQEGKAICIAGEPGDELFVLLSGTAEVKLARGEVIGLQPGSLIGEMALVDSQPRSANVLCTSGVHLISMSRKAYLKMKKEAWMKNDRELLWAINLMNENIQKILSDRLRAANNQLRGKARTLHEAEAEMHAKTAEYERQAAEEETRSSTLAGRLGQALNRALW